MLTLAYSVFQGNVGTAYRQRSQLLVFYFIFVAVGAVILKEKAEDRTREAKRAKQELAICRPPASWHGANPPTYKACEIRALPLRQNMCGITGFVRNDGKPVDEALLARMNEAIRHRGPDEDGFYVNGSVGLAMRRLAIIDLKAGSNHP
jgi:hypothetical protein